MKLNFLVKHEAKLGLYLASFRYLIPYGSFPISIAKIFQLQKRIFK